MSFCRLPLRLRLRSAAAVAATWLIVTSGNVVHGQDNNSTTTTTLRPTVKVTSFPTNAPTPFVSSRPTLYESIAPSLACDVTTINDVQTKTRQYLGQEVRICSGYVTAVVYDGFFLQEDVAPQSGIFVFTYDEPTYVSMGQKVFVEGTVTRYERLLQLAKNVKVRVDETVEPRLFEPVNLTLPAPLARSFRSYESMLVRVVTNATDATTTQLVVSDYVDLDRYGEIVVCASPHGRPYAYTALHAPNATEYASHVAERVLGCLTLDDNDSSPNPDPVRLGGVHEIRRGDRVARGGAVVTTLVGALYTNTRYGPYFRVAPRTKEDLVLVPQPRHPVPTLPLSEIKVAYSNLFKYYTTLDDRGANTVEEFTRQAAKTSLALRTMDADVYGLVELENNKGTVEDLVSRLNKDSLDDTTSATPRRYVAASTTAGLDRIGWDALRCDIIYDANRLELVGEMATLTDVQVNPVVLSRSSENLIFNNGGSRIPVAVTLRSLQQDHKVTVVVSHYKGRGNAGDRATGGDDNAKDGAGYYDMLRTLSSEAMLLWLETHPTGIETDNVLSLGDLNAYANESPVKYWLDNGYTSAIDLDSSPPPYTYVFNGQFGTLDYAFLRDPAILRGAAIWHVNADEPDLVDYNLDLYRNEDLFDASVPERFGDHDAILVGLFDPPAPTPTPTTAPTTTTKTEKDQGEKNANATTTTTTGDNGNETSTTTFSSSPTLPILCRALLALTTVVALVLAQ